MNWAILEILGAISYGISGTLVASEENYDLLGAYILGVTTSFGGGAIRNLLLGSSVKGVLSKEHLFIIALISVTLAFFFPRKWRSNLTYPAIFFDAIGLSAFAIQGAHYAIQNDAPIVGVIISAVLSGTGGGILRDLLAGRKPMIFYANMYALWALLAGILIGFGIINNNLMTLTLFVILIILRMTSVYFDWTLPHYLSSQKFIGFEVDEEDTMNPSKKSKKD